jgi:hypothetical protein
MNLDREPHGGLMRVLSAAFLLLILSTASAVRATAQSPAPDIRTLSLRSLRAGRSVRIAGPNIGTVTGTLVGVHDGSLWLNSDSARGPLSLAGIDSIWLSHGHGGTGAILGMLVGGVVARVALAGNNCDFTDNGCITSTLLSAAGITTVGALLGAVIGSGVKSWELRYP